jgi:hypothetical protein
VLDLLLVTALSLRIYAEVPPSADLETVKAKLTEAAQAAGCLIPRLYMQGNAQGIEILVDCPDRPKEAGEDGRRE